MWQPHHPFQFDDFVGVFLFGDGGHTRILVDAEAIWDGLAVLDDNQRFAQFDGGDAVVFGADVDQVASVMSVVEHDDPIHFLISGKEAVAEYAA
jgi:hypothetical protein